MESDRSNGAHGVSTPSPRVKEEERAGSPAPTYMSMRSDWSKDIPLNFEGSPSGILLMLESVESPAPSYLSMRTDWSKDIPLNFSGERCTSYSNTIGASPLTDMLHCSLCSKMLNDPVTIPCEHSCCRHCIISHWKTSDSGGFQCPECSRIFETKPRLRRNKTLARMVLTFQREALSPSRTHAQPGDVACDICPGHKLRAVKTCSKCDIAYCEKHIKDHYKVPALQRHPLVDVSGMGGYQELSGRALPLQCNTKSETDDVKLRNAHSKRGSEVITDDDDNPDKEHSGRKKRRKNDAGSSTSFSESTSKLLVELKQDIKELHQSVQVNLKNISPGSRRGRKSPKGKQQRADDCVTSDDGNDGGGCDDDDDDYHDDDSHDNYDVDDNDDDERDEEEYDDDDNVDDNNDDDDNDERDEEEYDDDDDADDNNDDDDDERDEEEYDDDDNGGYDEEGDWNDPEESDRRDDDDDHDDDDDGF